ncbi:serine proteinase [Metarhizium guizhouense ARSEF 977]|uniref:Serine proteinase n=1 Tax=Metarhizium guizhouense (strain ARSEF 977) TaxID=1276136 RepID=A0A0B4GCB2_METGA|nr:serine proteinase [Metarhizium guizhouense ARSEF 977]
MTAVTALFDPAMPDETSISLFSNTSMAQLTVALKSSNDGPDPDGKSFGPSASDYKGFIAQPSQLASGSFRGFRVVVAATVPRTEGRPTTNQISIVSPVYQGLASNTLENKKVAVSNSDTSAWVYFLDGTKDKVKLKEFSFSTGNVTSYMDGGDVALNSSLGAWYEPASDERFVVYQEAKNRRLKELSLIDRTTHDIVSTSDAKAGTCIAVTNYQGTTYLYYADKLDNVRRVTKSSGQWGSSQIVRDSPPVGDNQIAVVTANSFNHIFYLARDDTVDSRGFSHIVERI